MSDGKLAQYQINWKAEWRDDIVLTSILVATTIHDRANDPPLADHFGDEGRGDVQDSLEARI